MPLRIDSPVSLAVLWTNSIVPVVLGLGAMTFGLLENPTHWVVIPVCLLVAGFGLVPLRLARKLDAPVLLQSRTTLISRNHVYTLDGTERCELQHLPNLDYVVLTLHSGIQIRFIPKWESYFAIKKEGAQAWWCDILNTPFGDEPA